MSDRWAVALAAATLLGAAHPCAIALPAAVAVLAGALVARQPPLLCLAAALLASSLATRALAGLDGAATGAVAAEVTLLSDPAPSGSGLRMDVRLGRHRLEARAEGDAAARLGARLAGERVRVRGSVAAAPADAPWLVARHVAGRLTIHRVESWDPGDAASRVANGLRRTLVAGAAPLSPAERSLYTGLVMGDDRAQPADLADDFLGAGLTHLLAVSGSNVAFVLALAGPIARRLALWPRLAATLAVVGLFGVMTRFEPSVLRASAMAALAAAAMTVGSPMSRLRILALAVSGLVLVDPLLVRSVGFQLSASASVAIVVIAPRLAATLPGPGIVREPLAVTVAAQLGVAPVLLATFGPVPVASLPANLLAVPAAGAVMVLGMTAGLAAGLVGGDAAAALQLPTRLLLGWLRVVAARSAGAPLGALGPVHLALAAAGLVVAALGDRASRLAVRRGGLALAAAALAAAVLAAHAPPPLRSVLRPGIVRWHAAGTDVVVLGGAGWRDRLAVAPALEALRAGGVAGIDLLVVADGDVPPGVVAAVAERHRAAAVLGPSGVDPGAEARPVRSIPQEGLALVVGGLEVRIVVVPDRLVVDARPTRAGTAVGSRRGATGAVAGGVRGPPARAAPRSPPLRHPPPRRRDGHPQPHARLVLRPAAATTTSTPSWPRPSTLVERGRRLPRRRRRQGRTGPRGRRGGGARPGRAGRRGAPRPASTCRCPSTPGERRCCARPLAAGAVVGNDISGFADPEYLPVAAAAGASVVATHIRLAPRVPDPEPDYDDVVARRRRRLPRATGPSGPRRPASPRERIMVDAGLDLGKTEPQSLSLLRAHDRLAELG